MIGLGIDAGGSSSRWRLLDARGELASGTTLPITGHLFTLGHTQEMLTRLRALLEAVLAVATPDVVVAGITGFHPNSQVTATLTDNITSILGLDPQRIYLDNDISIAYAAAFAPGEGILVYAGTGSIAYHQRLDGSSLRVGGYGYLIDDAGAGYWIGHKGLKQVLRWFDEQGQAARTPLAETIYAALGSAVWDDIVEIIYGGGRSRVAALAPAVALAAEQADGAAINILQQAGLELARLAQLVARRLDEALPVAFAGGITQLSPVLTASLKAALVPIPCHIVTAEPVQAAAQLALDRAEALAK